MGQVRCDLESIDLRVTKRNFCFGPKSDEIIVSNGYILFFFNYNLCVSIVDHYEKLVG